MYIEREAAIKAIENDCPELVYYSKREAIDCIKAEPAADVAPVVRCKDCLYRKEPQKYGDLHCGILGVPMNDHDFCSYGERKENNV